MFEIHWIGNYVHALARLGLFIRICWAKDCSGISIKSQYLYALVFTTRYLDLFTTFVSMQNSILKIFFNIVTYATIILMVHFFSKSYEKEHDTARVGILITVCIVIAMLINHEFTCLEVLWTFSVYLEAVAMVPQFHFIIKANRIHKHMIWYTTAMAVYEGLIIVHWAYVYRCFQHYDKLRFTAAAVQFILYGDFFLQIYPRLFTIEDDAKSTLTTVDVKVDDEIPKTGHLTDNVNNIVLTPDTLTGIHSEKENFLVTEEAVEKY